MRVIYSLNGSADSSDTFAHLGPAALAVSFFDGVHRGHRRLVERAAALGQARGARPIAVTFWPHPPAVAHPEASKGMLTTLDEKLEALASTRLLDAALVLRWTPELTTSPIEALLDMLREWCTPVALVAHVDAAVGEESGLWQVLLAEAERQGLAVERLAMRAGADDEPISGERIWHLVRAGDVEDAARLLGRPYRLAGEVVKGDQRGRLLGFPTANLRIDERKTLPANGVYAVRARLPGEAHAMHAGVANVGVRPTFSGEHRLLVEVHLLDATMDLYGLQLGVDLVARLRDERRFDGVEALKAQIGRDAHTARERLAGGDKSTGTAADARDRSETPWA